MVFRAHKIALDPNNVQYTHLMRCAGVSRFVHNWALTRWNEQIAAHKLDYSIGKPSIPALQCELHRARAESFPWMSEVADCIPSEAIKDLGRAFSRYYKGCSSYPRFHRKGVRDSFRLSRGFFQVRGTRLYIPQIGWIRMREEIRYPNAQPMSITISRRADRWFASILCKIEKTQREGSADAHQRIVGVDAGVHEYVCSDGTRFDVPRAYRNAEKALRRAQQTLSRKEEDSANYAKQQMKVARLHRKVADIRADWLHKMSAHIVSQNATIVIEDLDVADMIQNRSLAKSVSDASFGEFARQIKYKAEEIGHTVIVADRFFPSSKLCSVCGVVVSHLGLNERIWVCPNCETPHDRDLNAAINLSRYAARSAVSACGELKTVGGQ